MTSSKELQSLPKLLTVFWLCDEPDQPPQRCTYILRPDTDESRTLARVLGDFREIFKISKTGDSKTDKLRLSDVNGKTFKAFNELYCYSPSTVLLMRNGSQKDLATKPGNSLRQDRGKSATLKNSRKVVIDGRQSWIYGDSRLERERPPTPLEIQDKAKKTEKRTCKATNVKSTSKDKGKHSADSDKRTGSSESKTRSRSKTKRTAKDKQGVDTDKQSDKSKQERRETSERQETTSNDEKRASRSRSKERKKDEKTTKKDKKRKDGKSKSRSRERDKNEKSDKKVDDKKSEVEESKPGTSSEPPKPPDISEQRVRVLQEKMSEGESFLDKMLHQKPVHHADRSLAPVKKISSKIDWASVEIGPDTDPSMFMNTHGLSLSLDSPPKATQQATSPRQAPEAVDNNSEQDRPSVSITEEVDQTPIPNLPPTWTVQIDENVAERSSKNTKSRNNNSADSGFEASIGLIVPSLKNQADSDDDTAGSDVNNNKMKIEETISLKSGDSNRAQKSTGDRRTTKAVRSRTKDRE